jgi:hypothetical protein
MTKGKIDIDFLSWIFKYFIGSEKEIIELDSKLTGGDPKQTSGFKSWIVPDKKYLFLNENAELDTIAHEALHLTNQALKHISHEIDVDNDEVQAHVLSWIIRKLTKALKRHNNKKLKL